MNTCNSGIICCVFLYLCSGKEDSPLGGGQSASPPPLQNPPHDELNLMPTTHSILYLVIQLFYMVAQLTNATLGSVQ